MKKLIYILIGVILLPINIVSNILLYLSFMLSLDKISQPFFLLSVYSGSWWLLAFAVEGIISDIGITLIDSNGNEVILLKWRELSEVRYIVRGLASRHEAVMQDGEKYVLNSIEHEKLKEYCDKHGVEYCN